MLDISKADWKLFRERIPGWQEAYMERLTREYIELLSSEEPASKKFWALDKRIREDKRMPGVQLELEKSQVGWDLIRLLRDGVIIDSDLEGFSKDLKDTVLHLVKTHHGNNR